MVNNLFLRAGAGVVVVAVVIIGGGGGGSGGSSSGGGGGRGGCGAGGAWWCLSLYGSIHKSSRVNGRLLYDDDEQLEAKRIVNIYPVYQ